MKLQFKSQKFQADAAKAVCDVFVGQPYLTPNYRMDKGFVAIEQIASDDTERFTGFGNAKLVPELTDEVILDNINKVQRRHQIEPSGILEGRYNLTVEMETGTRVIIVIGCINVLVSRVSGTLVRYNSCIA